MARTKCTAKKLLGKNRRRAAQKARLTVGVMSTQKRSAAGRATRRRDSLEIEDGRTTLVLASVDPLLSYR